MKKKQLKQEIERLKQERLDLRAKDFELVENILSKYGDLTIKKSVDFLEIGLDKMPFQNHLVFKLDYPY